MDLPADGLAISATPQVLVDTAREPVAPGKFAPTWASLQQYRAPDWFKNAKFGIWAHWGPQCQPGDGDWYARAMYEEGSGQYKSHLARYGHPSKSGFKDVIHDWKAENWDPDKLVALYKRVGAQYFFAMANHHDNLDLWDSQYQPWNSVAVGPKKNIVAGWAAAAKKQGLPFGISVHAAHAWSWFEVAQGADKAGPLAGVPYDGKLTKADGAGQWWEGLDPQELYAQNHVAGAKLVWDWHASEGSSQPDQAYCDKFYNRTMDLINKYQPDLVYFDDTALPLWPVSDAGLQIAAHFYNSNMAHHGGKLEAVLFGKILDPEQRKALVWDVERGAPNQIQPLPWQTDTCIGSWHYQQSVYDKNEYKNAKTVVQTLADVVSKNGNLLLNIPVRGDGTIDDKEQTILEGIAAWMEINKGAIFDTRPWKVFGEGPGSDGAPIDAQGFNEGKGKRLTPEDIRFTTKNGTLYAIAMGLPTQALAIKSLGHNAKLADKPVAEVTLLGSTEKLAWKQEDEALVIQSPATWPSKHTVVFAIEFAK